MSEGDLPSTAGTSLTVAKGVVNAYATHAPYLPLFFAVHFYGLRTSVATFPPSPLPSPLLLSLPLPSFPLSRRIPPFFILSLPLPSFPLTLPLPPFSSISSSPSLFLNPFLSLFAFCGIVLIFLEAVRLARQNGGRVSYC